MSTFQNIPTFKLIIVGDQKTGKTTFINRFIIPGSKKKYIDAFGIQIYTLTFETTRGPVRFNVWDIVGSHASLDDSYDGAILMFDMTHRKTYQHVPKWYSKLDSICGIIPVVLVGNKVDANNREVKYEDITAREICRQYFQYCEMSADWNYKIDLPFLYLTRMLLRNQNVAFTGLPQFVPIVRAISPGTIRNFASYKNEIEDTIRQNNIQFLENFQRDNRAQTHVWPQPLTGEPNNDCILRLIIGIIIWLIMLFFAYCIGRSTKEAERIVMAFLSLGTGIWLHIPWLNR